MSPWIQIEFSDRAASSGRRGGRRLPADESQPRRINIGALAMVAVIAAMALLAFSARERLATLLPVATLGKDVLATVDGQPVTTQDVDLEFAIQSAIQAQLGRTLSDDPEVVAGFRRDLLDQVVDQRLLLRAAQAAGITVSDAELEQQLPTLGQGYGIATETLQAAAQAAGVSQEAFREWARRQMLVARYLATEEARQKGLQSYRDRGYSEEQLVAVGVKPSDVAATLQKTADVRFHFGGGRGTRIAREGEPAPDFVLRGLDNRQVRLSDFRGKPVLINFWATWCTPCKAEMPMFVRAYEENRSRGLEVLALDVQEKPEAVEAFLKQLPVPFTVLLDDHGQVATLYRVRGLPTSYFVTADGTVAKMKRGQVKSEAELAALLDTILAPPH